MQILRTKAHHQDSINFIFGAFESSAAEQNDELRLIYSDVIDLIELITWWVNLLEIPSIKSGIIAYQFDSRCHCNQMDTDIHESWYHQDMYHCSDKDYWHIRWYLLGLVLI